MGRSQRIPLRDVRAMMRLQGDLALLQPLSSAWKDRALHGVSRLIRARVVVLCEFGNFSEGQTPFIRDATMHGSLDDAGTEALGQFFARPDMIEVHPFMKALLAVRKKCFTHRRVELVDDHVWLNSEVLNTYFRTCGVDDNMTSAYRARNSDSVFGFGLQRHVGDRPFEPRDRAVLDLIQRSCASAFERYAMIQQRTSKDLSPRLQQTLERLLAGDSEKQVARQLHLSPHTIHDYVKALYRHFGVSSRAELIISCLDPKRRNNGGPPSDHPRA